MFKCSSDIFLVIVPMQLAPFVNPFYYSCFMFIFVMLSCLFLNATLWSPAGKGLTSWLSCVEFSCIFVTFPYGILGQVWYLIVLIPDLCLPLCLKIC